jgi:outer-membrane receptor for ferric coprogen and ferric-rhodotorulic acid
MARYSLSGRLGAQLNVYNETYYSQNSWFAGYVYGEPRNARGDAGVRVLSAHG